MQHPFHYISNYVVCSVCDLLTLKHRQVCRYKGNSDQV